MNTSSFHDRSDTSLDRLFRSLATDRQRELVRLVAGQSAIDKSDLAVQLAAVVTDTPAVSVSDEDRHRSQISLVHRDLPALIEAGLLAETDDGTVVVTDHWLFDDELPTVIARRPPDELDTVFDALSDSRRRTVLSVLQSRSGPVTVCHLARAVTARETIDLEREPEKMAAHTETNPAHMYRLRVLLVHIHLPVLNDAGLIAYDDVTGRVAYEGHPVLRTDRLDPDRRSSAIDDTPTSAIRSGGVQSDG